MYKYEMIAEEIQKKIKDVELTRRIQDCHRKWKCVRSMMPAVLPGREAMELLVAKGLITKRRGAGTFVPAVAPGMTDQVGFSKSGQFSGFSKDQAGRKGIFGCP